MFIDIHAHIIPGIDDGASDTSMAVAMLRLAAGDGTSHIVMSPHFISGALQNNSDFVGEKCKELQQLAFDAGIDISIYPGCEVFISPDIPELLDKRIIGTINNSSYILIELPMDSIPLYTDEILYILQLRGLTPIIAHPERNKVILQKHGILKDIVKRGILAQVNSGSITGIYGKKIQNFAMELIKAGIAHFVASDAHTCGGRSPKLSKAAELVEKECGIETVERLFQKNGLAVIENRNIPVKEFLEKNDRKGMVELVANSARILYKSVFKNNIR